MHFDLAHAIITSLLVFGTIFVLERVGVAKRGKFSWAAVAIIGAVVFLLNLIWPYGP